MSALFTTALVLPESSTCLMTIPLSDLSIEISVSKGTLSSTHTPATITQLEPVTLSIVIFLKIPPEAPQTLMPRVKISLKCAPIIIGVEPAPTETPNPNLQSLCHGTFLPDWSINKS